METDLITLGVRFKLESYVLKEIACNLATLVGNPIRTSGSRLTLCVLGIPRLSVVRLRRKMKNDAPHTIGCGVHVLA